MLGMSNEQIIGLIRQILPVFGGIAVTLGWFTSDQVSAATATILQIAGPVLIVVSSIWSLLSKTKASLVATVAAMPEVNSVKTEATVAGAALARSAPANVTTVGPTVMPKVSGL